VRIKAREEWGKHCNQAKERSGGSKLLGGQRLKEKGVRLVESCLE
jgi:hypothetical protein